MSGQGERVCDSPGGRTTNRGGGDDTNQPNNNANIRDPLTPLPILFIISPHFTSTSGWTSTSVFIRRFCPGGGRRERMRI